MGYIIETETMKKTLFTIFFLISFVCFGQNEVLTDKQIFEIAEAYTLAYNSNEISDLPTEVDKIKMHNEKDITNYAFENAYINYQSVITNFPSSEYIVLAFFHIGEMQLGEKKYDESKKNLSRVFEIESDWNYYKRKAKLYLAYIAVEEKDYKNALVYLKEFEKYKKSQMSCGIEIQKDENLVKSLYEKCKDGK